MNDDKKKENSLIPIGSTGLVRVKNSIHITNKIINEHEDRIIQGLYPSVKIGNQIWITKNLDVDCYSNGDPIPEVKNEKDWEDLKTGAWCYYNNDPENGKIYGKLYNWYAVNDPRGLAPNGWRIPSDEDWTILTNFLGGIDIAGKKMKSSNGWLDNDLFELWRETDFLDFNKEESFTYKAYLKEIGVGNNESGFFGLPGGIRFNYGVFKFLGYFGYWWSSSRYDTNNSWVRNLDNNKDNVYIDYCKNRFGFSVRCLKN